MQVILILVIVDNVAAHFNEIFQLKSKAAKADVFHILSGMSRRPTERCFMWIGGFHPSKLLKLLVDRLGPLTEQQVADINKLEQSTHHAEDALSLQMEALQESMANTVVNDTSGTEGSSGNRANYMCQMANAMGKLVGLEGFLLEADNLRQQTLPQKHHLLTTGQSAWALLVMHDYYVRLGVLGALSLTRAARVIWLQGIFHFHSIGLERI